MKKGIFYIPLYSQKKNFSEILDEIKETLLFADKKKFSEAYFGEHLTDKHEKITSSIMMVAAASSYTNYTKLGTLTTNLNFYPPAVSAAQISLADNMSKGRLMLGIGSGANNSDKEVVGKLSSNNYSIMLESYQIIKKILYKKNFSEYKSKNFNISVKKSKNKHLGLGYFNKLYKNRKNLEVVMPALGENSHNVKICAKNKWSIVISNFCSNEVIENHIENYLKFSSLRKADALKKIKLSKFIFVSEKKNIEKYLFSKNSPYYKSIEIIYKKLKTYNKHQCFGNNVNNVVDAINNTVLFGNPKKIQDFIKNDIIKKFGEISSLIYVSIPKSKEKIYNNSLKIFAEQV